MNSKRSQVPEKYMTGGKVHGHLMHLYDDWDLTFRELKHLLCMASEGRLENVSEKLDGMNLVFTCHPTNGLRVARSGSDVKSGGMDVAALAKRFQGHDNAQVQVAFNEAFKVLGQALRVLSPEDVRCIFTSGTTWHSMEVIYRKNPNVIQYDGNYVVFHDGPTFSCYEGDDIEHHVDDSRSWYLTRHVDLMQKMVRVPGWQVRGPVRPVFHRADVSVLQTALNDIEQVQKYEGITDRDRIGDYLQRAMRHPVATLRLGGAPIERDVAARLVGYVGAPKLTDIKQGVAAETYNNIKRMVDQQKELLHTGIFPIELAVHRVALAVLDKRASALVSRPKNEAMRIRSKLIEAYDKLNYACTPTVDKMLLWQNQKLGNLDSVNVMMEGIVFRHCDKLYKMTGNFAPVNQVLGAIRYGR